MKLQVLGGGCPSCVRLAEVAEAAATELGIDYEVEKVTDVIAIAGFGVMMTPALVVDGEVKLVGKVPAVDELKKLLQ
jgi:small redox-active disulfide protein 2